MFKLVPILSLPGDRAVVVRGPRFTIGRGVECSLKLKSPYVSWNHCELQVKAEGLLVHDMASRNGTFVNFDRVASHRLLRDGDILGVATTCYRVDRGEMPSTVVTRLAESLRRGITAVFSAFRRANSSRRFACESPRKKRE